MLSGNRLHELPGDSLAGCHRLELLRIAANRLPALPSWLPSMPRLSWLAFAGNPFCDEQACSNGTSELTTEIPWQALSLGDVLGEETRRHLSRRVGGCRRARGGGGQAFKGAVTSDGLPLSEMTASLAAGRHPNLVGVMGRVSDHPSGIPALVMPLIDPAFATLAGPPSPGLCTRDVYGGRI